MPIEVDDTAARDRAGERQPREDAQHFAALNRVAQLGSRRLCQGHAAVVDGATYVIHGPVDMPCPS
eukprot:6467862-Pyramimonas_sp.AAC.1